VSFLTRVRRAAERLLKLAATAAMTVSVAQAQPQAQPAPQAQPQPAAPATVTRIARPALWRVTQGETTIYLFGTIHLLPENLHWRTPAIDRAVTEADELVTEVAPSELTAGAAQAIQQMGFASDAPPILERVPEEKRARLREMIAGSGLPMSLFDRMKTWTAAMTLAAVSLQQMGFEGERGVEMNLARLAGERPTIGLETAAEQMGFLDGLSEESQRAMLAAAVDDSGKGREEFERMLDAWSRGDVASIAETFNTNETLTPELRSALLTRRNAHWADWIVARLGRPGTVFLAVGAGHLAGEDSVIDLLARRGVQAERVQ
jgi:uncharacterized protein YbaP (TraB family)